VVRGGRPVLRRLSLTVPPGQLVGLLGPSGSGKTTLIRALVGVQRIRAGEVRVLGRPAGARVVRAQVGYVTQAPAVYADLTVRENLTYFAAVLGVPGGRIADVIAAVSIGDRADDRVVNLSGGERSRVSLATALLANPPLLILDEPTVGLDPVLREALWTLFAHLSAAGSTVLVSSHVMEEARRCQRLLLLRDGALLADETPQALLGRTGTEDLDVAFLRLVRSAEARR
jgi:ABC-2 type transport system ATP-binding protein